MKKIMLLIALFVGFFAVSAEAQNPFVPQVQNQKFNLRQRAIRRQLFRNRNFPVLVRPVFIPQVAAYPYYGYYPYYYPYNRYFGYDRARQFGYYIPRVFGP